MSPIITVENLGKRYRIHHEKQERYTSLRDVIARKAGTLFQKLKFGKTDKLKSISASQHLSLSASQNVSASQNFSLSAFPGGSATEDFWALKDVSFEVKQGEVVGIIGRNGAGKSTLLKILSRITEPTEGRVTLRGRVASLLEVGTGFHPELTGRENIFLNGAILGMTKVEIRSKFDEIVAFAEVEKFLDTPVKRYSSGMYVRLAFAVAAHLEPEILIIDEVLAVGDVQFQKKCMGRMSEVAKGGRTVLFVSHNLHSVTSLCTRAVVLQQGKAIYQGDVQEGVRHYLRGAEVAQEFSYKASHAKTLPYSQLIKVYQKGSHEGSFEMHQPIFIDFDIETLGEPEVLISIVIKNSQGIWVIHSTDEFMQGFEIQKRACKRRCAIAPYGLNADEYTVSVATGTRTGGQVFERLEDVIRFEVAFSGPCSERVPGASFRGVTGPGFLTWMTDRMD